MARRALVGLVIIATLIATVVTVENVRGRAVWNRFKAEWEAKGERFDIASVTPPPVLDAENFAMTPLLAPLLDYTSEPVKGSPFGGQKHWRDTNAYQRLTNLKVTGPKMPVSTGGWRAGKFVDLKTWQEHYRALTNFPSAPQALTPAEDVLVALTRFDAEIAELRAASLRPHARFPIHYDENFSALIPQLSVLRQFSRVAQLRALAELEMGRTDAALADVQLGLGLAGAIKTEPLFISSLVRIAILEETFQPIWEGLARRRWSEVQLLEIEKRLATEDLLAEFHRSIRGERAFGLEAIEWMRRNPRLIEAMGSEEFGAESRNSVFLVAPSGWFDQNKFEIARMYQEKVLPVVDAKAQRVHPTMSRQNAAATVRELQGFHPYRVMANMLFPAFENGSAKFSSTQTAVNEARIACALERHRLKHGQFPLKLDALVPDFMAKLPHDIINGEPLKYQRTEDGQFLLYSIGWDENDDGGKPEKRDTSGGKGEKREGDWVWRYPER